MPDLIHNQTARVYGSSGTPYELKNVGGVYSCSCPAWRNQHRHANVRTCGHLLDYRGEEPEAMRVLVAGTDGMPSTVLRRIQRFVGRVQVGSSAAPARARVATPNIGTTALPGGHAIAHPTTATARIPAAKPAPPATRWDRLGSLDLGDDEPEPTPSDPALLVTVSKEDPTEDVGREEGGDYPLLLANSWDESIDPTNYLMSEKLDGVRAYWDGENFISRYGNIFVVPPWFRAGMPRAHIDGEFWMGYGRFQETSGFVRRGDAGEYWHDIQYRAFDIPNLGGIFRDRVREMATPSRALRLPGHASYLSQVRCTGPDHLQRFLLGIEDVGGEGVMLRDPDSRYIRSRSNTLLKVKGFFDAEATVTGYTAGRGKHRGRVGALECVIPTALTVTIRRRPVVIRAGVRFKVGSGLSDAQRAAPPAIGSRITFRAQELTNAGVPRIPTFVGVRDYE